MYRGAYAYVCYIGDDYVLLSGWHGLKTTEAKIKDIQKIKEHHGR